MEKQILSGVEATTTSSPFSVEQYSRIGLHLSSKEVDSGNGVFTVEGTIDGTNWVALNTLVDNVTNTNAQNLTRVASKTLSTNTSVLVYLLESVVKAIRVTVTVTTDGEYSCSVIAN
jgi:hypothetical protein